MIRAVVLAAILAAPLAASAQTPVHLVVTNPYFRPGDLDAFVNKINTVLYPHGVITKISKRRGPFAGPVASDTPTRISQLFHLAKWGQRKRLRRKFGAVHFVEQPLLNPEGKFVFAGFAVGICAPYSRRAYSVSNLSLDRPEFIVPAIVHEIAHTLGASHYTTDPATFMHPDALRYANPDMRLAQHSKRQLKWCAGLSQ